jgi:uncharacterized damage-inducible protein DinB
MKAQELICLYDYNYWARDRIMEEVVKLSPQQFIESSTYGFGSIHKTLVHILGAEWLWRMRCQGSSPTSFLYAEDFSTPELLVQRWLNEELSMRKFLHALTDKELERLVQYKTTRGQDFENTLWQLLLHVVNHGTEHRSILAAELTGYGFSPGDIDLIHFLRSQPA